MIPIDRKAGALGEQIYRQIRQQVMSGTLSAGARLLPSRVLAGDIGVSRNTVLQAYDRLTAEGFVEARRGSGLFVARISATRQSAEYGQTPLAPRLSDAGRRVAQIPPAYVRRHRRGENGIEFLYGEPSYEDLPREAWARELGRAARQLNSIQLSYPDYQGVPELREALAAYLGRARGIACRPENLLVVHGTQEAIDLACRLLLNPDDPVILEQPYYRGFLKAALAAGASPHFVNVDEQGLMVEQLPEDARLVFVTPSHQFPTGGILPVGRRLELLAWAKARNAVVFEDDYDGEFRYGGPPVDSLKSLDDSGRVLYVGTVSKTFFPGLRLGWMVVADELMEPLKKLKAISDATPPTTEQLAFARFLSSGQFERHIFRVRKRYSEKRQRLLATLNQRLGDQVVIRGAEAGIHVLVQVPGLAARHTGALLKRCQSRGVSVHSSAIYYQQSPAIAELVIGYNAVPLEDIETGAGIIAQEISSILKVSGTTR